MANVITLVLADYTFSSDSYGETPNPNLVLGTMGVVHLDWPQPYYTSPGEQDFSGAGGPSGGGPRVGGFA